MLALMLTNWALVLTPKYQAQQPHYMGDYRAIMTATDRERITGTADVPDSKCYEAASRIRNRIAQLEHDAEILAEHHPQLHTELHTAICED